MNLPDITAPFVLLDDNQQRANGISYLFHAPERIISARTLEEAKQAFSDIDEAVAAGFFVAGWVAYECAGIFESVIASTIKTLPDEPLVWMIVTRNRVQLNTSEVSTLLDELTQGDEGRLSFGASCVGENEYVKSVEAIKNYIEAGDVYQVNYTYTRPCHYGGSVASLFKKLRETQPVQYGAFINTGEAAVLSLSPELFIRRTGNQLTAKPMKGTVARAANSDAEQVQSLLSDEKSRAENLMIVDLIRNDISRIATRGSVSVQNLFAVETLPSLHQMTSTVLAECQQTLSPSSLFAALFPCGSVTGAPKIRAMEIIAELEQGPRGVYCGAIGHFSPAIDDAETNWCFNVPIRTMVLKTQAINDTSARSTIGRLGIGSGIVSDSDILSEYAECKLKARFADSVADAAPFRLIETMRVESGRVDLLAYHMQRLKASAAEFGFAFHPDHIGGSLAKHIERYCSTQRQGDIFRLRLVLSPDGTVDLTSAILKHAALDESPKVCFAGPRICAGDLFRRHKTTLRSVYDAATAWASRYGYADVLFLNERGEVAEGAISNVFAERDGVMYTPPVSCGALGGVLRQKLLTDNEYQLKEKALTIDDLLNADHIYIGNALRGLRRVSICQQRIYN